MGQFDQLPKMRFIASRAADAQAAFKELQALYPDHGDGADVVVCIGGDGFLLEQLDQNPSLPVYGLNKGTVGFLLNPFEPANLPKRIQRARSVAIHP